MPKQYPKNDTLNAATEKQIAAWLEDAGAFVRSFGGLYNNSYKLIVAEYMAAQEGFTLRKDATDKKYFKDHAKIGDKVKVVAGQYGVIQNAHGEVVKLFGADSVEIKLVDKYLNKRYGVITVARDHLEYW